MHNIKNNKKLILLGVIFIQLVVCIYMGHLKRGFFCDEIHSYGLANSEDYSFIDGGFVKAYSADNNGWADSNFFKSYVEVNSDDSFSLNAAFKNQMNDVHPPLYYILMHIVCSLFPNSFTKWTGIGLNLAILIVLDILFYYIASYFFEDDNSKAILALIAWGFSAAGISNIVFIRMYLMLTAEMLAYIAVHIYIAKGNNKLSLYKLGLLCLSVIAGGLTHYYFYPFAFFFSFPICIVLLYKRKFADFFKYVGTLLLGFAINLLIFPTTIDHVFKGYRGTEVMSNLSGREENVFSNYYLKWIDESIFGGLLKVFLIVLIIVVVYKVVQKHYLIKTKSSFDTPLELDITKRQSNGNCVIKIKRNTLMYLLTSFAIIGFAFVAIVGSELKYNRYIYPIYPIIALWMVSTLSYMTKNKAVILCVIVLMCTLSIKTYGIDYRYTEYDDAYAAAKNLDGYDCLQYYSSDWEDYYTAWPLKLFYDETYFFNLDEISDISNILNNRKTKDNVVVSLPDFMSEEDATNILNAIIENSEFSSYEFVYHYYAQVYLLK